jgi:hypothetical protein
MRLSISNALGQRTLQSIAASFLPPLSGWCLRSWARSKAGQDQPGY